MGSRMELFEQIRRDHDQEGLSKRALAVRHGVHRRAVRQALESPVPPVKRPPVCRPAPKLGAYRALIDEWLEADRAAPRKQRHTARRVWQRLVEDHDAVVGESSGMFPAQCAAAFSPMHPSGESGWECPLFAQGDTLSLRGSRCACWCVALSVPGSCAQPVTVATATP
jgi:hypothetical protein